MGKKTTKAKKETKAAPSAKKRGGRHDQASAAKARAEAVEALGAAPEPPATEVDQRTGEPAIEASASVPTEVVAADQGEPAATAETPANAPTGSTAPTAVPRATDAPTPAPAATDAPTANTARDTAPLADTPDLAALRVDVVEAKAGLEAAEAEVKKAAEEARTAVAAAKQKYLAALAPYKDACKVQGRECEYEGVRSRSANVSERVTFEVELQGDHIRIAIKGKPETEERLPIEQVRSSPNRASRDYTERHLGPREVIGNKMGSLGNRLRAVLAAAGPR